MNFKKFLFYLPPQLLTETRAIAGENSISTSAFIRQSLTRNIRAHRATEKATDDAKARSAQVRF
jgi:hypothetical protein